MPQDNATAPKRIIEDRQKHQFDELARRITDLIVSQCYLYATNVPSKEVATELPVLPEEVTHNHRYKVLILAVQKNLTRRIENNEL